MRTWESKTLGFVTEKTSDVFTGVFSSDGQKIYEGDSLLITRISRRYKGKYHPNYTWRPISKEAYNDPKNWETKEENYSGIVCYKHGKFGVEYENPPVIYFPSDWWKLWIEIYPRMVLKNNYLYYKIFINN